MTDLGTIRQADTQKLQQDFYLSFDRTDLGQRLAVHLEGVNREKCGKFIGEGRHFSAYAIADASKPMDIVLKIANSKFFPDSPRLRNQWTNRVNELKELRLDLVPPFEIIHEGSALAMAMPFGNDLALKTAGEHNMLGPQWLPLAERYEEFEKQLRGNGFQLDDYVQMKCCQGVPFVCDFSDLKSAPKTSLWNKN